MNGEKYSHGRFTRSGLWPVEVSKAVDEALDGLRWMIPPWCHEITFQWNDGDDGCYASISTDFSNRNAQVQIYGAFMSQTKKERMATMQHELLHAFFDTPILYAEEVIRDLLKGDEYESLRERVVKDFRDKYEGSICDMEFCLVLREILNEGVVQE